MTVLDFSKIAARGHRSMDTLHSLIYFAPEADQHYVAAGLRPGRMGYFAGRAAPMGAVSAGVVAATFYNFNPELVARFIPRAWTLASPEAVYAARLEAVDEAWLRLLGPEALASQELAEAADLAREASLGARAEGRPLYAAYADLPWPDGTVRQLWHAITLLREFRGDGHITALVRHDLNNIDAIVTHTATGRAFTEEMARKSRGWSDEEWAESVERLRARGVLEPTGLALAEAGQHLRERVEGLTNELDQGPWQHLGAGKAERLVELLKPLSRLAIANGAYPEGAFNTK